MKPFFDILYFQDVSLVPCSIEVGSMSNLEQDGTGGTSCQRTKCQKNPLQMWVENACLHRQPPHVVNHTCEPFAGQSLRTIYQFMSPLGVHQIIDG